MDLNINLKILIYIIICLFYSIIGLKINANEDSSKKIEWEIIRSNNLKEFDKSIKWERINNSQRKCCS